MNAKTDNTRIFECFKAGDHTTMNGQVTHWSFADLEQIANRYPAQPPAPLCLGHPASDAPAFGEVRSLFHRRGRLYAVAEVGAALVDWVRSGRYKHVSSAFKRGPFGWELRHIGFLGATPPAVKGLAALQFADPMEAAPGVLCFADLSGTGRLAPVPPPYQFPSDWTVDPAALPLFEKARQVQADCPSLSFAECASAVERHIFERR